MFGHFYHAILVLCLIPSSLLLKVLRGLRQVSRAHHVVSIQSLRTLGHERLLLRGSRVTSELGCDADGHLLLLVPVDLELGHARLLDEDVAHKLADVGLSGRRLVEFRELVGIRIIHIVSNSEELLIVVI